jgi:hypothetical protein
VLPVVKDKDRLEVDAVFIRPESDEGFKVSAAEAFEIVSVLAFAVAAVAGVGLGVVFGRLRRSQHDQQVTLGSRTVDVVEHVTSEDGKFNDVRALVEDLTLASREHEVRVDNCLSLVGIVRFDPYRDLGDRQSTAVAFLNAVEDGAILTTVVSRDFARMHVKLIREGKADIQLAPEEVEALSQARARGKAPFTVRPRVEMKEPGTSPPADNPDGGLDAPMAR